MAICRKICGDAARTNLVLVTTMWDAVPRELGEARVEELKADYWVGLDAGSYCHSGSLADAQRIVRDVLKLRPVTLGIQRELVDERKELIVTAAGYQILTGLGTLEGGYLEELNEIEKDIEQARRESDEETLQVLKVEKEKYEDRLRQLQEDKQALTKDWQIELQAKRDGLAVERNRIALLARLSRAMDHAIGAFNEFFN